MSTKINHIFGFVNSRNLWLRWVLTTLLILFTTMIVINSALAQDEQEKAVQIISGHYDNRRSSVYILPNLKQGDTLYVYMQGVSGNLDPFLALADAELDLSNITGEFIAQLEREVNTGRDPIIVLDEISDELFLVWNDDSGEGYDAVFKYFVPADGSYQLIAGATPSRDTFGDFHLLVGINAPEVLTGNASSTRDSIAVLDRSASRVDVNVQEIRGTRTSDPEETLYFLHKVDNGDTLYVYIEATTGDLTPVVVLEDYSRKPLRSGNFLGQATSASFQYTFEEGGDNYRLNISSGNKGEDLTTGDYRLLVGLNSPEVLEGDVDPMGEPVVQDPVEVQVGIQMEQIADVDQKSENFEVVANLLLVWKDPALAFSPDTCDCDSKVFTVSDFIDWVTENDLRWPEFFLFNQQGNRWSQNEIVAIKPDGEATYFERFSATLQAPDFDFRQFPFDSQDFYIRVRSLFREEIYIYDDLVGASKLGEQLGEEEWLVTDFDTSIATVENINERSQFSFHFNAIRALTFYIIRIFVPLLLIILVAWITFFLKNYMRRVEITTGNLLLFIAFNFTISDSLPRLGYLTFLDAILAGTFLVSVVVVAFNVYLQRLEINGKEELAQKIDKYTLWIYPLAYVLIFGFTYWYFFL